MRKNKIIWVTLDVDIFGDDTVYVSPTKPDDDFDWYFDSDWSICYHWWKKVTGLSLKKGELTRVRLTGEFII